MQRIFLSLMFLALATGSAFGHAIDHRVSGAQAKVVEVFYADGRPFSFESFEVTDPGARAPFQIGRTDKFGRVVFVPDRTGDWEVKVWSEDGHGLQVTVVVESLDAAAEPPRASSRFRRWPGLVGGLILIGILGVVLTIQSRKKKP